MHWKSDIGLYALSLFVVTLSTFTALLLTNHAVRLKRSIAKSRVILSGICMGLGIWTTFLISAIALHLKVPFSLGSILSYVAPVIAISSFLIAFHFRFFREQNRRGFWVSCFAMSFGLNLTYAFALNGGCFDCLFAAGSLSFPASVVTGFVFSMAALWFASRARSALGTFIGSILIGGLAAAVNVAGLKAFGAAGAPSSSEMSAFGPVVAHFYLALSLAAVTYVICSVALIVHYNQEFLQLPGPATKSMLQQSRHGD
jgi:NO-binding membrane sensor protein with MHYT domain